MPFKNVWYWMLDASTRWIQPVVTAVVGLLGAYIGYDFTKLKETHPGWTGPLAWLEWIIPVLFFSLAVSSFIVAILSSLREPTISKLKSDYSEVRSQVEEVSNIIVILCDGLLLNLANKLGWKQESQARLSLYVHDPVQKSFVRCGRYAPNPVYMTPGRPSYPDTEGCISEGWRKGWRKGWHFDAEIPSQPAKRREHHSKKYHLPDHVTDKLHMKSTVYAVRRLDNFEGKAIAVLVVESTNTIDFVENDLRAIIDGAASDYARVIHQLRAYIPNPSEAAGSGL